MEAESFHVENKLPIRFRRNEDGELVKILLEKEWYDRLVPVYEAFKAISNSVKITRSPVTLGAAGELFNSLILEFGAVGWGFAIGILSILRLAAERSISLAKIVYEVVGGYDAASYDQMVYDGTMVAREIHSNR